MKRFLLSYYPFSFCHCFGPITLFYGLMMHQYAVSPFGVAVVVAIGAFSGFLLEVPSGTLADRFGYNRLLVASQLLRTLVFALLLFNQSVVVFALAFFLLALKETFVSGTTEAILFENAKLNGKESSFLRYLGYDTTVRRSALVLSGLVGACYVGEGFHVLLAVSLISSLVGVAFAVSIPQLLSELSPSESKVTTIETIKEGVGHLRRLPPLTWYILFGGVLGGIVDCLWTYWSIFASQVGLSPSLVGIFVMLINICGMVAGLVAVHFSKLSVKKFLSIWFGSGVLFLIGSTLFNSISAALMLLFMLVFYILSIVNSSWSQPIIPSQYRATITSIQGLLNYLVQFLFAIPFGLIAAKLDYQSGFIFIGVSLLIALSLFTLWRVRLEES